MSIIKGLPIRTTTWSKTKKDFNYPENDNNMGLEYGFEFIEDEDGFTPMNEQWFKSERDMRTFINQNELKEMVKI